jgi:hypothetical protein
MKNVLRGEKRQVLLAVTVDSGGTKTSDFSRYLRGLERMERHKNPTVKPMVFQ